MSDNSILQSIIQAIANTYASPLGFIADLAEHEATCPTEFACLFHPLLSTIDKIRKTSEEVIPNFDSDRPGFIIITGKSHLLKYIEARKEKRYILETSKMGNGTRCVLFDYDKYDGGIKK